MATRSTRVTVLVVGALPGQGEILKRKLRDSPLRLDTVEQPKHVSRGHDVYVVWAKFISHGLEAAVKKAGGRLVVHRGGLSRLIEVLKGIGGDVG